MYEFPEQNRQLADAIAALLEATAAAAAPTPPPETVLTIEETAERLKISKSLVYTAIREGKLKALRIGKRRLVLASEVARLIGAAT